MIPPSRANSSGRRGNLTAAFTIVELLVAVAISVIVVVLLANVVSQAMLTSRKASNELQAMNAAAAAIDLIAADLDTLAVSRQPYEYLQAFLDPANLDNSSVHCMRLLMICNSAEDAATPSINSGVYNYPDSGLPHAICYEICYQDPLYGGTSNVLQGGINNAFGLYRAVVSASTTFTNVLGIVDASGSNEYTSFWKNQGAGSIGNLMNAPANGVTVDFIAPNVVDLEIALYCNVVNGSTLVNTGTTALYNPPTGVGHPFSGVQITGTNPMEAGSSIANGSTLATNPLSTGNYKWGSPAYAEVSVTVIEDTAAKLWGPGNRTGKLAPAYLKARYGHTLTRKVLLHPPL